MSEVTQEMIDKRVNVGLQNLWHPVLPSWGVGNDPVGIIRLSENIALWRDNNGSVHAIEDRCPHRGASLADGKILDSSIQCKFHLWEFDVKTACAVANPNIKVRTFYVEVENGDIFIEIEGK